MHTHEEAGLFGPALARLCRAPHVYDMGNDWADVLRNYGVGPRNPLTVTAAALENAVIRHSDAVIAHFPLIADRVVQGASTPVETVFNISLEADPDPALASYIRTLVGGGRDRRSSSTRGPSSPTRACRSCSSRWWRSATRRRCW